MQDVDQCIGIASAISDRLDTGHRGNSVLDVLHVCAIGCVDQESVVERIILTIEFGKLYDIRIAILLDVEIKFFFLGTIHDMVNSIDRFDIAFH